MSFPGSTGGLEESSSESDTDPINQLVQISVVRRPTEFRAVQPFPNNLPVVVHTVVVNLPNAVITIELGGFNLAQDDFVLLVAEEILRSARARVLSGQITPQQL